MYAFAMSHEDLFERIFGSHRDDGEPLLDAKDKLLGSFIYNVACEEFQPDQKDFDDEPDDDDNDDNADTASVTSFEDKVEATKQNFDQIVELFKHTRKAKSTFLKNFQQWAPICKKHILVLRETAEAIHSDKFNSDIAKLVGTLVATVGGIACALTYLTPLAAVTVPLTLTGGIACGVGGGVVLGTCGTQILLLKKNLDEAKSIIKEHEEKFSLMAHWFTVPEELKKKLESVVSFGALKEVGEDLKKFFAEVTHETGMTIGDFKMRFKEVLKLCIRKMNKSGEVTSEFGDVFTPIVITFIFLVCVMKGKNRIILDCILINQSLALSLMSILNLGVSAGQLANGLARGAAEFGDDIFKLAFMKILVGINIAIDVLSVVLNSIEIHKRPEPRQTKKIKETAEQLEQMFLAIENVYNATKKYENVATAEWTTIVVNSVPDDAGQEDIKMAVKPHLPEKAWYCIKLRRLPTKGNNWFVKVPASHSEQLLLKSHLIIKEERCVVTQ